MIGIQSTVMVKKMVLSTLKLLENVIQLCCAYKNDHIMFIIFKTFFKSVNIRTPDIN